MSLHSSKCELDEHVIGLYRQNHFERWLCGIITKLHERILRLTLMVLVVDLYFYPFFLLHSLFSFAINVDFGLFDLHSRIQLLFLQIVHGVLHQLFD